MHKINESSTYIIGKLDRDRMILSHYSTQAGNTEVRD